jgi:pimeloyl-ACP methyl ester carboxylesterase
VAASPLVLIHSPNVGSMTWQLVADVLRSRGVRVVTPVLSRTEEGPRPYWARHAGEVVSAIEASGGDDAPVLVGHGGAGPLLPSVRPRIERRVCGYIFVDSKLPRDGASRLDLLEDQRAAALFRAVAEDRLLLTWSYEELAGVIPDDSLRRRFVGELEPFPLAVYEEPLPVFASWPDAPCGYLRLSGAYAGQADQARRARWPTIELDAEHYHMLVDPVSVADSLLRLVDQWGRAAAAERALATMLSPFRRLRR